MSKPSKSDLFRAAHAKARLIQGKWSLAKSYRTAFAIALKESYADIRKGVEAKAKAEANRLAVVEAGRRIIRENLERRLAAATQARVIAENNDCYGAHKLIAAARNAERAAADALRAAA